MGKHTSCLAAAALGVIAACNVRDNADRAEDQLAAAAPPPGVFPDQRCWKNGIVNVFHNSSIDPKLIGFAGIIGNGADAQMAFADAVKLWTTQIAASAKIKDVLKLNYGGATNRYAGDAAGMMKVESNRVNEAAFQVLYNPNANHMHVGDGQNTAATGHLYPMAMPVRMGDGWVWNDATAEVSSFIEIEKRLAETIFRQDANQKIIEGDITWFTHMSTMNNMASLIVWNYKTNKAAAPNFNYRPVMVHEIGHLLGLDHCTAADNCEVMQSMIGPGADPQIKAGEITALEFLYGPGGPCGPPMPPPPPTDGGPPPPPTDAPPASDAMAPDAPMLDALGSGAPN